MSSGHRGLPHNGIHLGSLEIAAANDVAIIELS